MTREKFMAYEQVREEGLTNMMDVKKVIKLSNNILTTEDCFDIMDNYAEYKKQFII